MNVEIPQNKEQIKKNFVGQLKAQGLAFFNVLKLGVAAGFLGQNDVEEIKKSFVEAGWKKE